MLQQLYMFGGLLVVYASMNTFTLKSLTQVARIGAIWQIAGEPAHHNQRHTASSAAHPHLPTEYTLPNAL